MKVYRIECDVDSYQSLLPEDDAFWDHAADLFSGAQLHSEWVPIKVFCLEPKLKHGDFFNFSPEAFIVNERGMRLAATPLEMAGEYLPIEWKGREGEQYSIYNVTNCVDVLDEDGCEWENRLETGEKWGIRKYAFHRDRFTEASIFKVPQDVGVYALEVTGDPEDGEFKAIVEASGLKGLVFEEVWRDK